MPKHQVILQAGYQFRPGFSVSLFGDFFSWLPFTPMVSSDVNGDGLANDRAFVFDPATAQEPSIASGMSALLRGGRSRDAECLASQLGRIVARASCVGPWTGQLIGRLDVPGTTLGLGRRARLALVFSNALAALDQLLHGAGHAHGWGANLSPDQVLYAVRGFDPAQKRFLYAVNSHFGKPQSDKVASPFGVTLDLSIDFSEPGDAQQVRRTVNSGRPGHSGVRMSADSIATRYAHVVLDPYAYLIFYSDSLLLSRAQLQAIRAADSTYRASLESRLWRPLGQHLYNLPAKYDPASAIRTAKQVVDSAWALTKLEEPKIRMILSSVQWQVAPEILRKILDPSYKPHFVLPS